MSVNQDIADVINGYMDDAFSFGLATRTDVVEAAFTSIQSDRQQYCRNDIATTAAEHYLFARYIVGDNFLLIWPICAITFPGYDAIKAVLGDRVAASKCPVSKWDWHHTLWKEWGCKAGSYDYWRAGELPPQQVSADMSLFGRGTA